MPGLATALELLQRTQAELRDLIRSALADGRYNEVAEIAKIADGIARLGSPEGDQLDLRLAPSATAGTLSRTADALKRGSQRGRIARTFPRFERESDKLVKIAWSKKDRAEYEHKAPRQVVNLLIEAIRSRKGEGAKFEAPDVLPLKDPKTRREVPSYQSYLALAWLRHEGVIAKYGREGYSLKPTSATAEHLDELWNALPSRD